MHSKLGDPANLPSVEETQELIRQQQANSENTIQAKKLRQQNRQQEYERERKAIIMRHRKERANLIKRQEERRIEQNKLHAARLPTGLKAIWFRLTGKYKVLKEQIEQEAVIAKQKYKIEIKELQLRHKLEVLNITTPKLIRSQSLSV